MFSEIRKTSFCYEGKTLKEFAKVFYKSKAWQDCRGAYFILRHGLCERCDGPGKIVHHRKSLTPGNVNNPDVTLNFANLELLCQDCHNKETLRKDDGVCGPGMMFDSNGQFVKRGKGGGDKEYEGM